MAADSPRQYAIRPQPRTVADAALEGCFRVYMSPEALIKEDIKFGDWIVLTKAPEGDGTSESTTGGTRGPAIAWTFQNTSPKKDFIKIHDALRSFYGFELRHKLTVSKFHGDLPRAQKVTVLEITEDGKAINPTETREELQDAAASALCNLDCIACGFTFTATPRTSFRKGRKRTFLIDRILPATDHGEHASHAIPSYFDQHSSVEIRDSPAGNDSPAHVSLCADFSGLFGLDRQIEQLKYALREVSQKLKPDRSLPLIDAPIPILIHGPQGTGKTTILKRLEKAPWVKHFRVCHPIFSGSMERVKNACAQLFIEARASAPSLIAFDDIDDIASNSDHHTSISKLLENELEALHGTQVLVVATVRKLLDVNERVLQYFGTRLEVPLPTEKARLEIVRRLTNGTLTEQVVQFVARRTPAFTANELRRLCQVAFRETTHRVELLEAASVQQGNLKPNGVSEIGQDDPIHLGTDGQGTELSEEDFERALEQVQPSAMGEAYIEVPRVRWSDIGGSEEAKRKLEEVLGFPIKHPDIVSKFRLDPSMGILLYGPPGCSKTLTAQAVATESGRNFIAVKGPELISKYVGESEQKIREVFRKARGAAPSVIFFDEIDALAPRRDGGDGHGGLHTVAALLNEMDGIESLKGVLILAATNRPEAIDPAMLRPQRLGAMIYMGPPNFEARRQIIAIETKHRQPSPSLNIDDLAKRTEGYSGADVVELCKLAAYEAAKEEAAKTSESVHVNMNHFDVVFKSFSSSISVDMIERLRDWHVVGAKNIA